MQVILTPQFEQIKHTIEWPSIHNINTGQLLDGLAESRH